MRSAMVIEMYVASYDISCMPDVVEPASRMAAFRLNNPVDTFRNGIVGGFVVFRHTGDVDVEENLEVYGDPDKLARVFDNILRNAIAYCYENTKIEIQARMKNNKIDITFTNSGDRIPGDMLQTIFEKFYRVDNSRSTGTGGAGLGLAIAKEIVELHDGQIMAKSDDLHTRFIVTLPSENELEENEEGSKNEIHTHRRHTFGGRPVHWKLPKGKAGKGDMDQS